MTEMTFEIIGQRKPPSAIDLCDLLTREIPPKQRILPWMTTQSLCMIHAFRGVGKTHVALEIAYAIAFGGKCLCWQTEKTSKVLYVDGELPAYAIKERLARIEASIHAPIVPGMLRIITPDLQDEGIPDLATEEGQILLDCSVADAEVLILDNLSCLVRGRGKENEAESWLPVQQWALKHRKEGRSILFIHHSGKNGKQRGTSKKEDLLDTVICLRRPSNYLPAQGSLFEVHFEKARNLSGKELDPFTARLTVEGSKQYWDIQGRPQKLDEVVKLAKQGMTKSEIAKEMGVNRSTSKRYYDKAREKGLL